MDLGLDIKSDRVPRGAWIITPLQELMEWAQAVVAATVFCFC
jgi:hypothetical protein